jgi:hypothetical protein
MMKKSPKDKVVVDKSLTKTNNTSKSKKKSSFEIDPGDTKFLLLPIKQKLYLMVKNQNVKELKQKMKKGKELGKRNDWKE